MAIILATSPFALADTASNSSTGADSSNTATSQTSNETNIASNNQATVTNLINIKANTGGNTANKNTGDGSIKTGDINGTLTITNDVNKNNITNVPSCCGSADPSSANNSNTGADSRNTSKVEVNNTLNITQNSTMNITNAADVDLNTGKNEANKNTGSGSITTGDISFNIGISNTGNENNIGGTTGSVNPPGSTQNPGTNPTSANNNPGMVLAAAVNGLGALPVTGGSLPFFQILAVLAAGVLLRLSEGKLQTRFLA